ARFVAQAREDELRPARAPGALHHGRRRHSQEFPAGEHIPLIISDFGLRIADCGLRIVHCGLRLQQSEIRNPQSEMVECPLPVEYRIQQYELEQGALEIQYIEEFFGEFPRKKTATEIVRRLDGRVHSILFATAGLPDDPGTVVPV